MNLEPAMTRSVAIAASIPCRFFLRCASSASNTLGDQLVFFRGTFAPFFRASESPIAIACFLLVTRPPFPPLPDFSVPRFLRRIALFTVFAAAFP
jgi:hypothetical protein